MNIRGLMLALATATLAIGAVAAPTISVAQSAAAKQTVDAAKASGQVGEQGDGYLGFVTGAADSAVRAAVAEINAGRKQVYSETAAKTGVTVEAAGQATARQLLARVPAGQYFKPLGGSWTKR